MTRNLITAGDLEALEGIRDCGLSLTITVRPPGDGESPLPHFMIGEGTDIPSGFGKGLEDAWCDFLNAWEGEHGERLCW